MSFILSRFSGSRLPAVTIAALLSFVAGCAGSPESDVRREAPTPPAPAAMKTDAVDNARIVVLGDSLSAGRGLPESEAFPAVVERLLREEGFPVEVINAGVSGDTSAGGVARLDWVLRSKPDILVVELGGNDALRGQPLESTERNLREIVERGRSFGAQVLLLGMDIPTSYGSEYTSGFAELYRRIAAEQQITLVAGFVREVGLDPTLLQPDGLHPTAEGHRRLARVILPALRETLESVSPADR